MREYKILVDGKLHKVKLLKLDRGSPFLVQVDEKTYDVKFADELDYGTRITLDVSGKPYMVELQMFSRNTPFSVKVNGKPYRVQCETAGRKISRNLEPALPKLPRTSVGNFIVDKGVVAAALPGKVVSLKVKVGDSVGVGDALCVLEAMKMENEVIAPVTGVVKEIMVSEGTIVNKGQTLVLID